MQGQDRHPRTDDAAKTLLDTVDLTGAVVTADAAHASRQTAAYIAGQRGADYLLTVKRNTPGLQRAIFDKIQAECDAAAPDHCDTDRSHGRTVRRSLCAAAAGEDRTRILDVIPL